MGKCGFAEAEGLRKAVKHENLLVLGSAVDSFNLTQRKIDRIEHSLNIPFEESEY
jgi:hypothetical protein